VASLLTPPPPKTALYQKYFNFFAKISFLAWNKLTRGDGKSDPYFDLLNKFSILQHLTKANFASRPVARDGITYNIDSIRAIPFTMLLAQMREFSSAFYGTGTAFELGSKILEDGNTTTLVLLKFFVDRMGLSADKVLEDATLGPNLKELAASLPKGSVEALKKIEDKTSPTLYEILSLYTSVDEAVECVAALVLDLKKTELKTVYILREMYENYAPFKFSLENKESSLLVRNYRISKLYMRNASAKELELLETTEKEAKITRKWVLSIMGQSDLFNKTIKISYKTPELEVLHRIQAKFMQDFAKIKNLTDSTSRSKAREYSTWIQMTILAISEGLGFGG